MGVLKNPDEQQGSLISPWNLKFVCNQTSKFVKKGVNRYLVIKTAFYSHGKDKITES